MPAPEHVPRVVTSLPNSTGRSMDTIFALSSGGPPAGIGVIRVTGPAVKAVLLALIGRIPEARRAVRARFRDACGEVLDDGLAIYFPGPRSVTGEDLAEFHCHGGRAVITALEAALAAIPDCRLAEAGEFTRRAFANGRIDLAEAEGLGDLLSAETDLQRRNALLMAGGALSRNAAGWRDDVLMLSAEVEAALDFSDEDDVAELTVGFHEMLAQLRDSLAEALSAPHAEQLREGFRVALAGPPNAGKSTLFNALVESEAAITASIAGTTRDVLVRPVSLGGIAFSFVDMAGLRDVAGDEVEAIGIERAEREVELADLVLWLGAEGEGPDGAWEIDAQCDVAGGLSKTAPLLRLSARTGEGMDDLRRALIRHASEAMPRAGLVALNRRQRDLIAAAADALGVGSGLSDPLLVAENLRIARQAFDRLLGNSSTEDMLDAVFGRFCIGK